MIRIQSAGQYVAREEEEEDMEEGEVEEVIKIFCIEFDILVLVLVLEWNGKQREDFFNF